MSSLQAKRPLTNQEISELLSFLPTFPGLSPDVLERHFENHAKQLRTIALYPSKLPELRKRLERNFHRSQIEAGKNVGALASSSIGEKNTQSSLSSFHQAGQAKVALLTGVPRLGELVNVTREIRTPSMEIHLNLPLEQRKDLPFVKQTVQTLFEYKELIDFILDYDQTENRHLTPEEEIWHHFHRTFFNSDYQQCTWSVRLFFNLASLHAHRRTLRSLAQLLEENYRDAFCVCSPDNRGIIDVYLATDNLGSIDVIVNSIKHARKRGTKKREEIEADDLLSLITDENKEYYFLRDLVIPSLLYLQVGGVENIKKCYYEENKDGTWLITTKGSNLRALLGHPLVDWKRTTSNHLWDVYDCLGIEATKAYLRAELYKLLSVSPRHLDLLINSMTYSGKPVPCTRYGIDRKAVGPFAQISFEGVFERFFEAANMAECEDTRGVASSIILGKKASLGSHMAALVDIHTGEEISEEKMIYDYTQELERGLKEVYERQEQLKAARMTSIASSARRASVPLPLNPRLPLTIERKRSGINTMLKSSYYVPDRAKKEDEVTVTRIIVNPPDSLFFTPEGEIKEHEFEEAY